VNSEESKPMSQHEDAFEAFVNSSYTRLVRLARSLDPYDPGQAEDNVQTALVRVAQRFPSIADPYRYACRVVINQTADHRRWRRRRPEHLDREVDTESHDHADAIVARQILAAALARLPLLPRQVLVLRYLEGFSEAEVADLLGKPLGTIKSAAHRGIRSLRQHLLATEAR
jgi:RNA polymerase sigma factor (sigma-70 family)